MRGLRPDLWSKIKMGRDTSQRAKTNTKPKTKKNTTRCKAEWASWFRKLVRGGLLSYATYVTK